MKMCKMCESGWNILSARSISGAKNKKILKSDSKAKSRTNESLGMKMDFDFIIFYSAKASMSTMLSK